MAVIVSPTVGTHYSQALSAGKALNISAGVAPLTTNTRWTWVLDGVAESGANAGSNLLLQSINDDGKTIIATPITVTRSSGAVTLTSPTINTLTVGAGGLSTSGNVTISGTGLLFESVTDSITAFSTGGQTSATALTTDVNRVTVVAAGNDSVKLPLAVAGSTVLVINHGAKSMQVFGAGTDTIDDVATATGVAQMVGSLAIYTCTSSAPAGKWYSEGLGTGYSGSLQTLSFADALSANSGGVQAGATAITTSQSRFTTVGGAGYSAVLPAAAAGLSLTVINAGANTMNVFPAGTDAIDQQAASAAYSLVPNAVVEFFSTVTGFWHTVSSFRLPANQYTSISSGNGTLTGAQVAGADFCALVTSGATAQTTPTAALMLAAIPNGVVGQTWRLRVVNTNAGTLTLTMDASVTATGTLTLATNTWREFILTIVTATTATMKQIGVGTTS